MKNSNADKDELYYDAMECLEDGKNGVREAEGLLREALKIDVDYVQTYVGLASVHGISGNKKKAEEVIKKAYELTLKQFPKWPRKLEWGFLENRAYLRALQYRADLYWDNHENDKAAEIFRLLLKLNPNDNQGLRYEIAGLYAGIDGKKVSRMFDEGNERQNWNELQKLVKDQNKKHHFLKESRGI
jgi:tetratricopeptide (TPR) repeat protein